MKGEDMMTIDNIEVFGQNSIRITAGDKKIYIDPFEIISQEIPI